ncbi:MAG: molybdenum cofactor guanylyltransferase [Firmicutes bacterium HGW-Firmicutes-14]|nr:MAG: molybdenum cofactor guanylyltransferase [Firmicutes bacterium HGW-Firmicutes-14]
MIDAAAIILAGGKSTRMGRNKALVRVKEQKMLEGIIKAVSGHFPEVLVSGADPVYDGMGLKTVPDIYTGRGPLGGIHACLKASGHRVNFLAACDMPFVDAGLAEYMVRLSQGYDVVVPKLGEYYQPLFAVYMKDCIEEIERQLDTGQNKIISFYPRVRTRLVGADEIEKFGDPDRIFFNVNTPGDLNLAREWLK